GLKKGNECRVYASEHEGEWFPGKSVHLNDFGGGYAPSIHRQEFPSAAAALACGLKGLNGQLEEELEGRGPSADLKKALKWAKGELARLEKEGAGDGD